MWVVRVGDRVCSNCLEYRIFILNFRLFFSLSVITAEVVCGNSMTENRIRKYFWLIGRERW